MGEEIFHFNKIKTREMRKQIQMIFQDPLASLNPRMNIAEIIAEPLRTHFPDTSKIDIKNAVNDMMKKVGLLPNLVNRYPHEFSGGQCQRIGIARALILNPKLIICDEPVSALDVSVQAQVLNLLNDLKDELSLTLLFISHNLSVVENVSDRIAIMYLGHIVELLDSSKFAANCKHPYSKALLSAIPIPNPNIKKKRIILKGDVPSPINPPSGCVFRTRCPNPTHDCKEGNIEMGLIEVNPGHWVDQCCVNCG